MGYCSNYFITIHTDDEKKAKEIFKAIEDRSGYSIEEDAFPMDGFILDSKWYDSDDDLAKVSKEFPDIVIEMSVEGEDRDDNWTIRVKNGEKEIVQAVTATPPFTKILIEGDQKEESLESSLMLLLEKDTLNAKRLHGKVRACRTVCKKLSDELTAYIKDFVSRRGKDGTFSIDYDIYEYYDPILMILVTVDRRCEYMAYENVMSITIKDETILFKTEHASATINKMDLPDIIDVFQFLSYMDDEANWTEDLVIVDGTLKPKETA